MRHVQILKQLNRKSTPPEVLRALHAATGKTFPLKVGRRSLWKVEELGKAMERFEAKP
jgi:hypothetical protein